MKITDITASFINGIFNTTEHCLDDIWDYLTDKELLVDYHSCGSDDEVDQTEFDYLIVCETDDGEERTIGVYEDKFLVGNDKGELF